MPFGGGWKWNAVAKSIISGTLPTFINWRPGSGRYLASSYQLTRLMKWAEMPDKRFGCSCKAGLAFSLRQFKRLIQGDVVCAMNQERRETKQEVVWESVWLNWSGRARTWRWPRRELSGSGKSWFASTSTWPLVDVEKLRPKNNSNEGHLILANANENASFAAQIDSVWAAEEGRSNISSFRSSINQE